MESSFAEITCTVEEFTTMKSVQLHYIRLATAVLLLSTVCSDIIIIVHCRKYN